MLYRMKKHYICTLLLFLLSVQSHQLNAPSALSKINSIEDQIHQDLGHRGLEHLFQRGDVLQAAECLSMSQHIAILTGFFIPGAEQPETDGPLGAFAIAHALTALGKKVVLITDQFCECALTACYEAVKDSFKPDMLTITIFPSERNAQVTLINKLSETLDCIISIERVGQTKDGSYRTMRGIDITQKTAPLDDFFLYAKSHPERHIRTIGIGDGGNEIGMGAMRHLVEQYIPKGKLIACIVPADHLVIAGVSNWGGYALAAALCCLNTNPNVSARDIYTSNEEQLHMLQQMVSKGCCDGVTLKPSLSADGMNWDVHARILDNIRAAVAS